MEKAETEPPALADSARPWQSYTTVYTNAKAGMEGVDKEKVQRVVYEMSKGSKYFENEERKEAFIRQKIENMRVRDESLKEHIKFLETQGIAGVSHHNLLFSKTERAVVVDEEQEVTRTRAGTTFVMNKSSGSSHEHDFEWAQYAFKPKEVNLQKTNSSADSAGKLTESEIKGRISRLSQILANKTTVSKLPDKGEKIQKQIAELNIELDKMRMTKRIGNEVIDLDYVTGKLENVLNL